MNTFRPEPLVASSVLPVHRKLKRYGRNWVIFRMRRGNVATGMEPRIIGVTTSRCSVTRLPGGIRYMGLETAFRPSGDGSDSRLERAVGSERRCGQMICPSVTDGDTIQN